MHSTIFAELLNKAVKTIVDKNNKSPYLLQLSFVFITSRNILISAPYGIKISDYGKQSVIRHNYT